MCCDAVFTYIYIYYWTSISIAACAWFSFSVYRRCVHRRVSISVTHAPMGRRHDVRKGGPERHEEKNFFLCDYSDLYLRYHVRFGEVVYRCRYELSTHVTTTTTAFNSVRCQRVSLFSLHIEKRTRVFPFQTI